MNGNAFIVGISVMRFALLLWVAIDLVAQLDLQTPVQLGFWSDIGDRDKPDPEDDNGDNDAFVLPQVVRVQVTSQLAPGHPLAATGPSVQDRRGNSDLPFFSDWVLDLTLVNRRFLI